MTANCRSRNIASFLLVALAAPALAQVPKPVPPGGAAPATVAAAPGAVALPSDPAIPPGYGIGADDVLSIIYWKDKDMTTDSAQVRPDGRIALPQLNDVDAGGLSPEQLRQKLNEESKKYMEDPNITVVVREINSRRAFITGEVNKPGPYSLTRPTSVMQLISMAGGLKEYANGKKII